MDHEEFTALPRRDSEQSPHDRFVKAEARYRALVESIPAITFIATLDQVEQELYVSPQIEAILGFTQKEWLENPILWYSQLHPDDQTRWHKEFANTVAGGVPFRSEYRFIAKDGHVVWIRGEAQMVRDATGKPMFLQGIAFDITEHKKAEAILLQSREQLESQVQSRTAELAETNRTLKEEMMERQRTDLALRDREARLRSIVESAVDGIVLIDTKGTVEAFNPAAERIFGYTAAEVLGKNVSMLMPSPYRDHHDGYITQFLKTGVAKVIGIGRDVSGLRRDGSTFPMELAVSETLVGSGTKFTGIVRDVTDRKREEAALIEAKRAAESANRLKSEFLANMSHEIRTPMNGIIGMTELTLATELDPTQKDYLETVLASTNSLLAIVNDILDFSKIEAGKMQLSPIAFSLRSTLEEILKPLGLHAHAKRLEMILEIEPDVPDRLLGDPGRLGQILLNVIGNALKFTHQGEILIRVGVNKDSMITGLPEDHRPRVNFTVSDTGIGIPTDKRRVIFDAFTQADGSTTRQFGGTGLGLAISKKLVEMMDGQIWVDSEPGQGSSFHFYVAMPAIDLDQAPESDFAASNIQGSRILVVDDNVTCRRVIESILRRSHYVTQIADSAADGLQAMKQASAQSEPFQSIVLDFSMPGMSFSEMLEEIKGTPCLITPIVVLLTSPEQLADVHALSYPEHYEVVYKPVIERILNDKIRKISQRSVPEVSRIDIPQSDASPGRSLRVLLVDDNAISQRVFARMLEKMSHQVTVVGNGREAIAALENDRFDCVLMDIQPPLLDGVETMKAIRHKHTQSGEHTLVIALTANAMQGDREACLNAGFDDYVAKPISRRILAEVIERNAKRSVDRQ